MKRNNKINKCSECRKQLSKDEYALSIKLLGECIGPFCITCFSESFDISVDDLNDKIQMFKDEGCTLFE